MLWMVYTNVGMSFVAARPSKVVQFKDTNARERGSPMLGLVKKIFGDSNEREIKRMLKAVDYINDLEAGIKPLSDEELKGKTMEFRNRLEKGEELDDLLPEAFAVVREAAIACTR